MIGGSAMIAGSRYDYNFSVVGIEKDFAKGLAAYLHELSDKIVCTSDIDAEYDESDPTHVPVLNFAVDDKLSFTLRRGSDLSDVALGTAAKGYTAVYNNLSINLNFYGNSTIAYDTNTTRTYIISSFIGIDFINLLINTTERAWNNQLFNYNLHIIYTKGSEKSYFFATTNTDRSARANIFNISSRTFTEFGGATAGVFTSRFAYSAPPGKIDYVKNSVYTSNGGKLFDITAIYDCTTVALEADVSLDDGRYMAVSPHQLVKIETP